MASKDTIQADLAEYLRDKLRTDTTILAFNPTVDAKNWIFIGRPKSKQLNFSVPRIILEPIDEAREEWTVNGKKDILIPYLYHAWVDQAVASTLLSYQIGDRIKKIVEDLEDDPDEEGIFHSEVISFSNDPEPTDNKVLIHVTVRQQLVWREN